MKSILFILIGISPLMSFGQRFKKIYDPALVAQEKRQVFQSWGNWLPEPKYLEIFGATLIKENISPQHAIVWGKHLPHSRKNRRYMQGEDIRPLKSTGLETQRFMKTKLMENEAKTIKKSIDTIYKRGLADMAHNTHLTANADPLYLLYYKKMLEPLKKFPENPSSSLQWGIKNELIFTKMKNNGLYGQLQQKLIVAKETYNKALKLDMPRGKRFLMYHKALMGWRDFQNVLLSSVKANDLYLTYSQKIKNAQQNLKLVPVRSDKEIITNIMQRYNHKF